MTTETAPNQFRIKIKAWAKENGLNNAGVMEAAERMMLDATGPAMCSEGCEGIEPDGTCEHGCPSLLLAMGVI